MPERKSFKAKNKRYIAVAACLLISVLIFSLASAVSAASNPTFGNVAGGDSIDVRDVRLVMRKALELEDLTFRQRELADVNNDGIIDVTDVTMVMRKALGLIDSFPVEEAVDEDAYIVVSLYHDQVDGFNWPADSELTIKAGTLEEKIVTEYDGSFRFRDDDLEIKPGQTVVVSIGGIRKVHIIRDINITKIDPENDLIRGTIEAGSRVEVRVFEPGIVEFSNYPARFPISSNISKWSADFSKAIGDEKHYQSAYDIGIGDIGEVRFVDLTNDVTIVFWECQETSFTVVPEENRMYGSGWTPVSKITVTIGEDVYTTTSAPVDGFFWIEDVTVVAGDLVKVTDGVTTSEHVVTGLTIESLSIADKKVVGSAAPGSIVDVYLYEPFDGYGPPIEHEFETVTVDGDGNWLYEFTEEIAEDMFVEAFQFDDNNNSTLIRKVFGDITED